MPSNHTSKRCSKCKEWFPLTADYFHRHSGNKDGFSVVCRGCKHGNGWREKLPDGYRRCKHCYSLLPDNEFDLHDSGNRRNVCIRCNKEYKQQYYQDNKADLSLKAALRYAENPEPAKRRASKWYYAHIEAAHTQSLNWGRRNPEKRRLYCKISYERHPETSRASCARRRARIKEAVGSYSKDDLKRLIQSQRDGGGVLRCWWCGDPINGSYHADHRIPLNQGGTNNIDNICIACPTCNLSKGDKMPWEWIGKLL